MRKPLHREPREDAPGRPPPPRITSSRLTHCSRRASPIAVVAPHPLQPSPPRSRRPPAPPQDEFPLFKRIHEIAFEGAPVESIIEL